MLGSGLTQVTFHKYLGVYITSNLSWSRHCNELRSKTNRVLAILQINLSGCSRQIKEHAYLCLVRPQLEYSTSTWSQYTQKDIKTIESVQRAEQQDARSTTMGEQTASEMIADLNWDSLENRRKWSDSVFFFKIQNKLIDIPFPNDMVEY